MLGKGLESLIPQGGYNNPANASVQNPTQLNSQPTSYNPYQNQQSSQEVQYPQTPTSQVTQPQYTQVPQQPVTYQNQPQQPQYQAQPQISQQPQQSQYTPPATPFIISANSPVAAAIPSVIPPYSPAISMSHSFVPVTSNPIIYSYQSSIPTWSDNGAMVRASIGTNQIDNIEPVYSPEEDYSKADSKVYQLDVNTIFPNPHQPRRYFDEDSLNDLANSIREFGIIQPLVVTRVDKNGQESYQLIAGERRLLASKKVGLKTVPVVIKSVSFDRERLELAIIENIQRENLNPLEAARSYARLQDEFGLTQREIAGRMGKSRETIANNLRLLNLPTEIQKALETGKINESHARILLQVDDIGKQREMFDSIIRFKPSVRELKSQLKRGGSQISPKRSSVFNPELQSLQSKLEETLGTKVQIIDDGSSGKITINYYSPEELNNLISKLSNPWSDNY